VQAQIVSRVQLSFEKALLKNKRLVVKSGNKIWQKECMLKH
jgi:hypothetical protein